MSDLVGPAPEARGGQGLRFVVFGVIVVLVVTTLGARLFMMQIAGSDRYDVSSRSNGVTLVPIRAERGLIYDRNGRPLVNNVPTFTVLVRPGDLPLDERDAVVDRLSILLDLPTTDIIETLDRAAGARFALVRVATDVPTDVARIIAEEHLTLPGVEIAAEARRDYLYGTLVSQIMGYTGPVTKEDLAALADDGYLNDDLIGKTGVESTFESVLRGRYGVEEVERDAQGRTVRSLRTVTEAVPGASIQLSIDLDTQIEAETALRFGMDSAGLERGALVVMDPQTGEILAMSSMPTYDNNLFASGISNVDYQELVSDPARPLLNFAINENYAPGSTFKLVTGSGALADGVLTPSTLIETRPYLTLGQNNEKFWDWNRQGFGTINIIDGFAESSDTFFYQLAGDLGIDRLAYWAHQFGFGERTGIDLPGEARGLIPDNAWKQEIFHQQIYPGEVYQSGIGQGYDTATPLQVLNAYAALANGGSLYKPQIVHQIVAGDGSSTIQQPELIRELPMDPAVLRTMREGARRVLTIGHTGDLVRVPLTFGGKTGTAEFGLRNQQGGLGSHDWFVAFVPDFRDGVEGLMTRTDSQLAVLAFAYDSHSYSNASIEMVKYFLQLHYQVRGPDARICEVLENRDLRCSTAPYGIDGDGG
ncbi:MAG: penicillin-binding protein 2 [Candidatus Limnocylindrales bacterium]